MAGKEIQSIVAAWEHACVHGYRAALITVVATSGSTYRKPGARMLVIAANKDAPKAIGTEFLGSISGGCLEDDAREHALETIRTGRAALVHYDTTAESDILFGTGAGCEGTVDAFIEPLPLHENHHPLACLSHSLRERRTGALASIISVEPANAAPPLGSFLWVDRPSSKQDSVRTNLDDPVLIETIVRDARAIAVHGESEQRLYPLEGNGQATAFICAVHPPRSLLICGAGQDAVPLARLAKEMGWRVRITDNRRAYLTPERFPGVDELIPCPIPEFGERVAVEHGEAVVVMTHRYLHDRDILRDVISSPADYIGVLGPRRRTERLLAELAASGSPLDLGKRSLRRLHAPAGLDIGAEAPEQIALSIVAEIEAVRARRNGGPLKDRVSALH